MSYLKYLITFNYLLIYKINTSFIIFTLFYHHHDNTKSQNSINPTELIKSLLCDSLPRPHFFFLKFVEDERGLYFVSFILCFFCSFVSDICRVESEGNFRARGWHRWICTRTEWRRTKNMEINFYFFFKNREIKCTFEPIFNFENTF